MEKALNDFYSLVDKYQKTHSFTSRFFSIRE